MSEQKKKPIHSLTHETYVSQDDDECYWNSVQNQAFRRNEGVSQLELLAKLPRVLSKEADTIEANPPEAYEVPKRDLGPFLRYAGKEEGYGLLNGKSVEQRATELSKKMNMSLPLVSYHINGNLKTDGLKKMGLVDIKEKRGRMNVTLSTLGKLIVKGYVK